MIELDFTLSLIALFLLLAGTIYTWGSHFERNRWFTCQVRIVDVYRGFEKDHNGENPIVKSFELIVEVAQPIPKHIRDLLRRTGRVEFKMNIPFKVPGELFCGNSKSVREGDLGVLTMKYNVRCSLEEHVDFKIWSLDMDTEKKESESKED